MHWSMFLSLKFNNIIHLTLQSSAAKEAATIFMTVWTSEFVFFLFAHFSTTFASSRCRLQLMKKAENVAFNIEEEITSDVDDEIASDVALLLSLSDYSNRSSYQLRSKLWVKLELLIEEELSIKVSANKLFSLSDKFNELIMIYWESIS